MQYRLLGPLQVVGDDLGHVRVAAPKRRALLAALLLHANEPMTVHELVDALWGAGAPVSAVTTLRAHLSRLRRDIGPVVSSVPGGYVLRVRPEEVDALAFEDQVNSARRHMRSGNHAEASAMYESALSLWRGSALADFVDEAFAQAPARRLEELRLVAREERAEADLGLSRDASVIGDMEALTAEHPFRERAWAHLMRALYRSGRQADALATYRRLRAILLDELGIDPAPELQQLEARILQQDPGLASPRNPFLRSPVQLPAPLTPLLGRDADLAQAVELLRGHRLVTFIGTGGVGKTRLAIATVRATIDDHPDGVVFVDLSSVKEAPLVMAEIGEAVGGGERPEMAIGGRQMLLLLDNFEQVLHAAPAVAELLSQCSGLRVLVTSRAPLQIRGEQVLEVNPLAVEHAVELFEDRARAAVRSSQGLDAVVLAIVDKLDHLPLAIELAAARARLLAPNELRDRLSARFELLASTGGDLPARHRTLRATIAWSYDLLSERARLTLRRLSVFTGAFDLKAGCAVAESGLEEIAELVDHSLLQRVGNRYHMLDTIREFAALEADEHDNVADARARHLAHFVELGLSTGRETTEGGPFAANAWQTMCRTERDNFRRALETAAETGDRERFVKLYRAVAMYWIATGGLDEGERWGDLAISAASELGADQEMNVLMIASEFPRVRGDHIRAAELKERAVTLARRPSVDPGSLATVLDDVACSYAALGEYEKAAGLLAEALDCRRRSAVVDPLGMLHTVSALAELALRAHRPAEAMDYVRQLDALEAEVRDRLHPDWIAESKCLAAKAYLLAGRTHEAMAILRENLRESADIDFRLAMVDALEALACLTLERDPRAAAQLLGMANRLRAESGVRLWDAAQHRRTTEALTQVLGQEGFAREQALGHGLPLADLADAALALTG